MSKVIKKMEMDSLKQVFGGVRDLVVLSTKGLSCQGDYNLRATLRKKNVSLRAVKNSLAIKVFQELGIDVPETSPVWKGPTTFAFGAASIAELSRAIDAELKLPKNAGLYKDK